jgi:hypothetical protein
VRKKGGCTSSSSLFRSLAAVDDAAKDVRFFTDQGLELNLHNRLLLRVHDEKLSIISATQHLGLAAQAQANGTQQGGLSRSIGSTDNAESIGGGGGLMGGR